VILIRVIILAAGTGSRLGHGIPKALVELGDGKTIMDQQLENIAQITSKGNVRVVLGYRGHLIEERYPDLEFVYNHRYSETNTSKSLLIGLEDVDDDVIWMNGDVVFDPSILKMIGENPGENLICVDNKKVGEEEVKYSLDSQGFIRELSKNVTEPLGEAVGINQVSRETIPMLRNALRECQDQDYFERGVEILIENGETFRPLNIGERFCIEVDFPEDLVEARKYFMENHK